METRTRPVVRHLVRMTVVAVAMALAVVGFQPAANAAVSCTPTAYTPVRYAPGDGSVYVSASGIYACASSVERIRIIVTVSRDGAVVQSSDYTADRRPPNKLLNVLLYLGPNCVPGTYATSVEGWSWTKDAWGLLLNSHGSASSPAATISSC
jgi:hypothetical protein